MVKVAINGFGRIGRMVLKAGFKDPELEFVAVNDLTDVKTLAHLLKYDSVHKQFPADVKVEGDHLLVDGKVIKVFAERDPEKLPWGDLGVDLVIESTGIFRKKEQIEAHIRAGAKKVLLSAPPKGGEIPMYVMGVNDGDYSGEDIISNASCTTNCLAPVAKILEEEFGIEAGFMTTTHGYTGDQKILDAPHKDLRRARAAALSIIPTSTGAAGAVGKVIPSLAGKLDGIAMRVPTPDGSVVDLVATLKKEATVEEINAAMKKAAEGSLKGYLEYQEDPIVSIDIVGNPYSSIFDPALTHVHGKLIKVISWYDNEWGYSVRMIDMIKLMVK